MNRHSLLFGNDPTKAAGRKVRGQRVYCSDRGQRGGCGRTSSIFLEDVLPRHTVSATVLGQLLIGLISGLSIRAAFHQVKPSPALESVYHLLQRLCRRLDAVRVRLSFHDTMREITHS